MAMTYQILKFLPPQINQNRSKIQALLQSQNKINTMKSCPQVSKSFGTCVKSNQPDNLAAVLHGIRDLRMEKRPMPQFDDNQVLLQMEVVGICGSDVHYYLEGRIGPFQLKNPMIIGHEASGTVLECGKCVTNLQPGDKVAIEPQRSCRKCQFCKSGNYHLCPNLYFCATPPDDGNLSRYFVHDSDFCFRLPCNLDHEHGALMEPLAVAVHACKRAEIASGDSVLVLGSGTIGLVSVLAAKAYGASKIVAVDIEDYKVKKALDFGASCAINVNNCCDKDILKSIHDVFGHHPHKTIDCCGHEQALRVGLEATRSGGKLVLVGMGTDNANLPISECVIREVDILGVFRYVNDYPTAIKLVESGKIDPKPIITHHFKLEESVKAFETACERIEPIIKILIHANPEWQPADENCKSMCNSLRDCV